MRFFFIITGLIIMFLITSCDPYKNRAGTFHMTLKGSLNNTTGNINLGDTIKFELKMPAVITATNLVGESRSETVNSLQRAFFGYHIFRVDTINHKVYSYTGDSMKVNYFLNPGYEINRCQPCYGGYAYLRNDLTPFMSVLHMVPQVKGIFYLDIDFQEGNFKVNNNFEGLFSTTINVADKHLEIVDRHIPGFANAINQSGKSVYCFQVN